MTPPVPRYLRGDVTVEQVASAFNQFQQETIDALASSAESSSPNGQQFFTPAFGDVVVTLKTGLNGPAKSVLCSWLERVDGLPLGGPWSIAPSNVGSSTITVTFSGLPPSTAFTANFEVR